VRSLLSRQSWALATAMRTATLETGTVRPARTQRRQRCQWPPAAPKEVSPRTRSTLRSWPTSKPDRAAKARCRFASLRDEGPIRVRTSFWNLNRWHEVWIVSFRDDTAGRRWVGGAETVVFVMPNVRAERRPMALCCETHHVHGRLAAQCRWASVRARGSASLWRRPRKPCSHARLPPRARCSPAFNHVLGQANRNQTLRIGGARATALVHFAPSEHLLGQLREFFILLRLNNVGCHT
jgi:hypothetical protein